MARTDQYSGPGNAGLYEVVTLERMRGDTSPVEVLTLDEQSSRPPIDLRLAWNTPTKLAIYYTQPATINLQTVRFADIDIVLCGPTTPSLEACTTPGK